MLMSRKVRTHIVGADSASERMTPKHLTKQEFAKRLYKLMLARGWHQSELARQADLPRDAVSRYIRGKALPEEHSLSALAKALGVAKEELLPNRIEAAIDEDEPAFEMKISPSAPDMAWLRVNRLVSASAAFKIAELLQNDDVLNRSRSSGAAQVQQVEGKAT